MKILLYTGWGLFILSGLAFFSGILYDNMVFFKNFIPALLSLNLYWLGLILAENIGQNLLTIFALIIGLILHYKYNYEKAILLIRSCIALFCITLILT